jgi:hypothetical protein
MADSTQPVTPDDDKDAQQKDGTQIVIDDEEETTTQILNEDDSQEQKKSPEIPSEDLSLQPRREKTSEEKKEIEDVLASTNPETLTKNFDMKEMKEVLEEFHEIQDDTDSKPSNGGNNNINKEGNESDETLIELAKKAIQEQKSVHFVMNFCREITDDTLLLSFLREKLSTLIKIFSVATLRGDSPENFFENWNALTNVLSLVYPGASLTKIHQRMTEFIKNGFPNLIEQFFEQFDLEKGVLPQQTLRYLFLVCREIYFVYATPQQQMRAALFLLGKLQSRLSVDINNNNNYSSHFAENEWAYFKNLYALCDTVVQKTIGLDHSFETSQVEESKPTAKKTKRDDGDKDEESPSQPDKKPKIDRMVLPKDIDPEQKWILRIDRESGEETLIREDAKQRQVAVYCRHKNFNETLSQHLAVVDAKKQKLCPMCDKEK